MPDENDADDEDDVQLHTCDVCGKTYLTARQLRAHSHKHKDE